MKELLPKGVRIFLPLFLLLPVASPALAQEPWLEVHVLNRHDGRPVNDAAVCLGTGARGDQFGARRSDARGVVRFSDLSANPLAVTVSAAGYQGRRQALQPLYDNRVLVVKLVTGGGGPSCGAPPSAAAESAPGLRLEAVRIRHSAGASLASVLVSARASGPVNQIRISEQRDFADADWQDYKPSVPYTLSAGEGAKRLYVQVRRVAQVQGASIQIQSPVRQVVYARN